jgi:hypothetical protein
MGLRCGEQFRRRYIEGEIIPPGIGAGRGTAVHAGNKANLGQKILSKKDLPLSDLKDATRDGYVRAFSGGVYIPKDEISEKEKLLNGGLNEALRLIGLYREKVAPEIQPMAVEESFEIDVGLPLNLAGRMDYQEKPKVGDIKTTTKSWAEGQILREIQPVFYSFAHEKMRGMRPEFVYHILVALKKEEKLQEQKMTASDNDYRALFAKLKMFCHMLETGTFLPANPGSWWCSEKWCGYWGTCPYQGNGKRQNWI